MLTSPSCFSYPLATFVRRNHNRLYPRALHLCRALPNEEENLRKSDAEVRQAIETIEISKENMKEMESTISVLNEELQISRTNNKVLV